MPAGMLLHPQSRCMAYCRGPTSPSPPSRFFFKSAHTPPGPHIEPPDYRTSNQVMCALCLLQVGGMYLLLHVPTTAVDALKTSPVVAQLMPAAVWAYLGRDLPVCSCSQAPALAEGPSAGRAGWVGCLYMAGGGGRGSWHVEGRGGELCGWAD